MVAERGFRSLIGKQRTVTMTLSAHRISLDYHREDIDSMTSQMENLELEKAEAKSSFCRAQNTLLFYAESHELPSRKAILDILGSLDKWSERAMETMSTLSDLYFKSSQLEKSCTIERRTTFLCRVCFRRVPFFSFRLILHFTSDFIQSATIY